MSQKEQSHTDSDASISKENTESNTLSSSRRQALGAIAAAGLGAMIGSSPAAAQVGGGPDGDELSHLLSRTYVATEDELPDPGVENRFVFITEGGQQWNAGDFLHDRGDEWTLVDRNFGSVGVEYVQTPPQQFTVAVLPDTQYYVEAEEDGGYRHLEIFEQQTQWLADNAADLGIEMVLHVGDVIESYQHGDYLAEWDIAMDALGNLTDAGIPYLATVGNHDLEINNWRNSTEFNNRITTSAYENMADDLDSILEYGNYNGLSENSYFVQSVYGEKFLYLALEFYPRDEVVDWADGILDQHDDATAFINTHAYTGPDGTRVADDHQHGPLNYFDAGEDWNGADDMWGVFSQHEHIQNVVSGHFLDTNFADSVDSGEYGNVVSQTFVNYQTEANGGDGWLRLMRPDVKRDVVDVRTYSPFRNEWSATDGEQFDYGLWEWETRAMIRGDVAGDPDPATDYEWTEMENSPWSSSGGDRLDMAVDIPNTLQNGMVYMFDIFYHPDNAEGSLELRFNNDDTSGEYQYRDYAGTTQSDVNSIPLHDVTNEPYAVWTGRMFLTNYSRPAVEFSPALTAWNRAEPTAEAGFYDTPTDLAEINFLHATDPHTFTVRGYYRDMS